MGHTTTTIHPTLTHNGIYPAPTCISADHVHPHPGTYLPPIPPSHPGQPQPNMNTAQQGQQDPSGDNGSMNVEGSQQQRQQQQSSPLQGQSQLGERDPST